MKNFSDLNLKFIADIDIEGIMNSLRIFNPYLRSFLKDSCEAMEKNELEKLKTIIQKYCEYCLTKLIE